MIVGYLSRSFLEEAPSQMLQTTLRKCIELCLESSIRKFVCFSLLLVVGLVGNIVLQTKAINGSSIDVVVSITQLPYNFCSVASFSNGTALGLTATYYELYSSNDGVSWKFIHGDVRPSGYAGLYARAGQSLWIDSNDNVYVSLANSTISRLFRSTDGGQTFRPVFSYSAKDTYFWNPTEDNYGNIYIGEYTASSDDNYPKIWVSTDKGASWGLKFTATPERHAHALTYHDGYVFASFGDTNYPVYRTNDNGTTWALWYGNSSQWASSSITAGNTSVVVTHNKGSIPSAPYATPADDLKGITWYFTNITATQMTITLFTLDSVDHVFLWGA